MSPLALMFPLAVILPVIFKLSLKEIVSPEAPADSNLEAKIVPLALILLLAVILKNTVLPPIKSVILVEKLPLSVFRPDILDVIAVTLVEKLPLSDFKLVTLVEKLPLLTFKPDILDVIAVNLVDTLELSANKFVPKILPLELISDEAVIFVDDTCSI